MIEKEIIGRFYFKQTLNLNLIGEYSNNISLKNKKFSNKLFLFYYFNLFYKYNIVSLEMLRNTKNSLAVNIHILNYLYKFYNLYMEILLIKYTTKKYYKMYIYINFFNFFFKFLN